MSRLKPVNKWVKKYSWYLLNLTESYLAVRAALEKKLPWWPAYFVQTEGRPLDDKKLNNMIGTLIAKRHNLQKDEPELYASFKQTEAMAEISLEFIQVVVGEKRDDVVISLTPYTGPKYKIRVVAKEARLPESQVRSDVKSGKLLSIPYGKTGKQRRIPSPAALDYIKKSRNA